jgi:hypothetical protein
VNAKTREELEEMTPEERKLWAENERKNVFGYDYKTDPKTGRPIEQGIGSAQQPTRQHVNALRAAEGDQAADAAIEAAKKRGLWPPPDHEKF